jgi:hypothetical protein
MADMNPVEFAQLISSEEPHSVSLLLPTHPAGRNVREDVIRLKNLVSRAETTLRRQGVSPGETAERLEPAQRLIHEEQLSQNHGRGLAVYLGQTHSRVLDTAFPLEEICTVANRFYVRPLLPMADSNGDFYLLALAQKSWRFFRGDRSGLTPEDLPGAPENLAASAHLDQPESHVQFHTGTAEAGVGGSRPAMFHGQGAIADKANQKVRLHRYCQRVAQAVYKVSGSRRTPLVLAATEPIGGEFREASHGLELLDDTIKGSPEQRSADELHAAAIDLMSERLGAPRRAAVNRYRHLAAHDQALGDPADILHRAYLAQIDTLFIPHQGHLWGRFDPDEPRLIVHDSPEPGDEDLFNLAASKVLISGGTVYPISLDEMPEAERMAAILRFTPPAESSA